MRLFLAIVALSLLAGCGTGSTQSQSTFASTTASHSRRHPAVHAGSARRARARMSSAAARQTLVSFLTRVDHGDYARACAMFTPAVRARLSRDFGGCLRNLSNLHTVAQNQRAGGVQDVLERTVSRVKAARFAISGHTATTTAIGRPGTVTTLLLVHGHWEIAIPAT